MVTAWNKRTLQMWKYIFSYSTVWLYFRYFTEYRHAIIYQKFFLTLVIYIHILYTTTITAKHHGVDHYKQEKLYLASNYCHGKSVKEDIIHCCYCCCCHGIKQIFSNTYIPVHVFLCGQLDSHSCPKVVPTYFTEEVRI